MMKKLTLLILLLCGLGCTLFAQTELYNRYASNTNIKVACVNNMELDSVSRVDVTLLQAMDDEGWEWMLNEFNVVDNVADMLSIMFTLRDKHHPEKSATIINEEVDLLNSCYLCVDYRERMFYIFTSDKGMQNNAVVKYLVSKMVGGKLRK